MKANVTLEAKLLLPAESVQGENSLVRHPSKEAVPSAVEMVLKKKKRKTSRTNSKCPNFCVGPLANICLEKTGAFKTLFRF